MGVGGRAAFARSRPWVVAAGFHGLWAGGVLGQEGGWSRGFLLQPLDSPAYRPRQVVAPREGLGFVSVASAILHLLVEGTRARQYRLPEKLAGIVCEHLKDIFGKLAVRSRTEAAMKSRCGQGERSRLAANSCGLVARKNGKPEIWCRVPLWKSAREGRGRFNPASQPRPRTAKPSHETQE